MEVEPPPAPPPEPLPPFAGECEPVVVAKRMRALGMRTLPDGYEGCLVDRVAQAPGRPESRYGLMALVMVRRPGTPGAKQPLARSLLAVPPEAWVASHANAEMYLRYLRTAPDAAAQRGRIWRLVLAARAHADASPAAQQVTRSQHALRMQGQLIEMALPEDVLERERVAYRLAGCRQHLLEAEAAAGATVPSRACQAMVVDPEVLAAEAEAMRAGR